MHHPPVLKLSSGLRPQNRHGTRPSRLLGEAETRPRQAEETAAHAERQAQQVSEMWARVTAAERAQGAAEADAAAHARTAEEIARRQAAEQDVQGCAG